MSLYDVTGANLSEDRSTGPTVVLFVHLKCLNDDVICLNILLTKKSSDSSVTAQQRSPGTVDSLHVCLYYFV